MSAISDLLMSLGKQLPEDARSRQEAKSKDDLARFAAERLKNKDDAEKAVIDQGTAARTALGATNAAWLNDLATKRAQAIDTADLAKEQAVTAKWDQSRGLSSNKANDLLNALESGVGETARTASLSKYKEPGEVDRFRYMSQGLTPFSGNKEVDTALGNAQATAKMEQDSAERQAARDAAEQAQADRERSADERLNSRLDAQRKGKSDQEIIGYNEDGAPIYGGKKDFQEEQQLRSQLNQRSKTFIDVRDSYHRLKKVAENPSAMSDISIIYQYMKMNDPGSTVREGEFATAQNAAGIPDRIVNSYNKALKGQRLSPEQRSDIMKNASNMYDSQKGIQSSLIKEYRKTAADYGLSPDRVVGGIMPDEQQVPSSGGGGATGSGTTKSGKKFTIIAR